MRVLHLHSSFHAGGKELRAARLINAFGPKIEHHIVSAEPDSMGATAAIDPAMQVFAPQDFPSLKGKPLPGRTNILVTHQEGYQPEGVHVFPSIEQALEKAISIARSDGVDEVMIIGGGDVYAQLMDRADRLYISHVDLTPPGDVHFPPIDPNRWLVVDLPEVEPHPRDQATYRVKVYERRQA